MAQIILDEGAAPSTPASGKAAFYVKTDGLMYTKDDAGTEFLVVPVYIPQVAETTSHTFALTDAGKHIYITGTATLTIPTNASVAFPVGTALTFINNAAAVTTFTTTSLTVYKAGTSAAWASGGTLSIRGMCTFVKVATDTWFVNGTTLS